MKDSPGAWLDCTGPDPAAHAAAGTSRCAASIIAGELSTPHTRADGQRSASKAVRCPGPQPRSATNSGRWAPTLASRSTNGLARSSPNRRYWVASHMTADPLHYCSHMPVVPLYPTSSLDVKRYALVMAQRAGTEDGAEPGSLLRDEVDDLVAAWRAQRPDLDVEPLQVLSRISRLARHLDIARRGAFADHGLEAWEFDVLSALRRQGPPFQLTPGALLRATLVTSGTMTNRIDRLATAGLVRREPDPKDKRGVLVTLTEQGMAKADAALADLLRREHALLAALDHGERQHLADLMRILLAPFRSEE